MADSTAPLDPAQPAGRAVSSPTVGVGRAVSAGGPAAEAEPAPAEPDVVAGPVGSGPPPPASPLPPPRRRGLSGTAADMTRSLGVLLAAVAVVWLVSGMWHDGTRGQLTVPDWQTKVRDLPATVGFAVGAPATLPAGWAVSVVRVTAGTRDSGAWTMTVTTTTDHYIDLQQGSSDLVAQRAAAVGATAPTGSVRLAGTTWTTYDLPADPRGTARHALVAGLPGGGAASVGSSAAATAPGPAATPVAHTAGPATLEVLSGNATALELATLATALRTVH